MVGIGLSVSLLLLLVHVRALAFLCDDAFISFRYSVNLAAGHGLVFNPGERVEGYSNFLWVLILAGFERLAVAPETAAPIASVVCALAVVFAGVLDLRRHGHAALWFALLLAASSGFAAWSTGGLETALFTLCVFAAFLATVRSTAATNGDANRFLTFSAFALVLASLTRPEGPLLAGLTGTFLLARALTGRLRWRSLVLWSALFAVPLALYFLWRHAYFGRWLPNTFAVKSAGAELLPVGLGYLASVVTRQGLWLVPVPFLALAVLRRGAGVPAAGLALGITLMVPYLGYVVAVGGDFMDLGRFVVPLLPIAAWLVAQALGAFEREVAPGDATAPRPPAWATVAVFAFVAAFAAINLAASIDTLRPWHRQVDSIGLLRQYRRDWTEVGRLVRQIGAPTDTIAITAAGIIPYYSGLYTIDQLGLVSADLSGYKPRKNVGLPGHKLIASGEWLERTRPQFLLGHPVVVDSMSKAKPSLMLEHGWESRIMNGYKVVAGQVSLEPPRYFALAVRRDALAARDTASAETR